jgi:hypothetical protein
VRALSPSSSLFKSVDYFSVSLFFFFFFFLCFSCSFACGKERQVCGVEGGRAVVFWTGVFVSARLTCRLLLALTPQYVGDEKGKARFGTLTSEPYNCKCCGVLRLANSSLSACSSSSSLTSF